MATALRDLPRYLVLNPVSTVRIEMQLEQPACEIDVELDNPKPGRSFVLLIGQPGGPYVQRVRLAGRARLYFDPEAPGAYELLLANPQHEPLVLRLRGHEIPDGSAKGRGERAKGHRSHGRSSRRVGVRRAVRRPKSLPEKRDPGAVGHR
jgi:hypothetical protein